MKRPRKVPRVVLDTNLVLSSLVFAHGRLAYLRNAWQNQIVLPLASKQTISELIRVLAYPKFKLSVADRQELLADYLPWCVTVEIHKPLQPMPTCRDPKDQAFLELAVAGKADYLVTGDLDLLSIASEFVCPIVNAEEFGKAINSA